MDRIRHNLVRVPLGNSLALVLAVLLIFANGACAMSALPSPVLLTADDTGKTVSLVIGQTLVVKLDAQPGTGYRWELDAKSTNLLALSNASQGAASMPGGNETQSLTFIARSAGEGDLTIIYRRPWERGIAPVKTFSVKVIIKAP